MLFENVRVHPIELKNNVTGQVKVLFPGEIIDLPEAFGRSYYNYLKPVNTEYVNVNMFVEDIQNDIATDFNTSVESEVMTEAKVEVKQEPKKVKKMPENILVVEEEVNVKGKKGRPKVYAEDLSSADRRKIQRKNKKEQDAKFKDLKF